MLGLAPFPGKMEVAKKATDPYIIVDSNLEKRWRLECIHE